MNEIRRPLKRSVLCGIALFILVLCIVLRAHMYKTVDKYYTKQ